MERVCLALALLCAGCFLEELKVSCVDSREDCRALNVANGIAEDACEVYQCRADHRGCELRERDYDEDGYLDRTTCSDRDPKRLDCNDDPDGGTAVKPDADELCDGIDNDCDGWIDEGVLADGITIAPRVSLGEVTSLSYSESRGGPLNAASTYVKNGFAQTELRSAGTAESPALVLQLASNSDNCTRDGWTGHCTLRDLALASSPHVLIAVGVQTLGCAGTVRVASRSMANTRPLIWDGDQTMGSNLLGGVASDAGCSGTNTAHNPSIALSSSDRAALVTWRAVAGAPSELVGIGLAIEPEADSEPRVRALGAPRPLSLSGTNSGFDRAVIRAASRGFLVAYDTPDGLEVAHVSELQENMEHAFSSARRLRIASPGARHPALALADDSASHEAQSLGLAWRVSQGKGSKLLFARVSWDSESATKVSSELTLRNDAPIVDGPAIAYVTGGFRADPSVEPDGGWFLAWIEREEGRQKLLGLRVSNSGGRALEEPFVLARDESTSHPHLRPTAEGIIEFAFASGAAERALNLGSLACGQ